MLLLFFTTLSLEGAKEAFCNLLFKDETTQEHCKEEIYLEWISLALEVLLILL